MLGLVVEDTCDGLHPETGEACVLGEHKGFHESASGSYVRTTYSDERPRQVIVCVGGPLG